jgi:hypothetical protein
MFLVGHSPQSKEWNKGIVKEKEQVMFLVYFELPHV